MKSRVFELVFVLVFLFVTIFNMIGLAIDSFGFDMSDLPQGEFLYSAMSPDGENTLKIYRVTVERIGVAIRGEIVPAGVQAEQAAAKNIYWETGADTAIAAWTGEGAVSINGHEVNIGGTPYDSRRQIELPEASAKNRMS